MENEVLHETREQEYRTLEIDIGTIGNSNISFTDKQLDILRCLVENEIESDVDNLTIVKGKEKEFWKNHILDLKNIKAHLI